MKNFQVQPKQHQTPSSRFLYLLAAASFSCILYLLSSSFRVGDSDSDSLRISGALQQSQNPTAIEHIVFGIASNNKAWKKRKEFVKLWWEPRQMRGCVFLDGNPDNTTSNDSDANTLPPICISGDTSRFRYTFKGGLRSAIRVARVVSETVALNHTDVRWFVFGDDDTIFVPENLVKTLSKYDHRLWYYIGTNSEAYIQNINFSFDMAYGGAGFAISYPLAKALTKVFDSCLERYPHLYGSDARVSSCLLELGVGLTREPGFHQMDVLGDTFGLLATHPLAPLVSLHHMELTDPIFPNMTTIKALQHFYGAAKVDPHRILQQSVCYDRWFSWTISVSWGYAVQVFGHHVFIQDVIRAQETFRPWRKGSGLISLYSMPTMERHRDPCRRPTNFFLDKVSSDKDGIRSNYRRLVPDNCTFDMASPKKLDEIRVYSKKLELDMNQIRAPRRHCCDILSSSADKVLEVEIRECKEDELIYMHA